MISCKNRFNSVLFPENGFGRFNLISFRSMSMGIPPNGFSGDFEDDAISVVSSLNENFSNSFNNDSKSSIFGFLRKVILFLVSGCAWIILAQYRTVYTFVMTST